MTKEATLLHGYQRLTNALYQGGTAGSEVLLAARSAIASEMSVDTFLLALDLETLADIARVERVETHFRECLAALRR